MTDIVERSKKAQETIDQIISQNEFLKHMCKWQEKEIVRLREALSDLVDWQNGPPLATYTEGWNAAMKKAHEALGLNSYEQT